MQLKQYNYHKAFASPAGFHFCLETETKQKIQGLFHLLTIPKT